MTEDARQRAAVLTQWIEAARQSFGAPPRTFSPEVRKRLLPAPPFWMRLSPGERLWTVFREREQLVTRGKVVWGALVQANELLFRPGPNDCPANAIFSPDNDYDGEPLELGRLGHELFALKGTRPDDPVLRKVAADITNEMQRSFNFRIPDAMTGGREVYFTTIMVHRRHLPGRVLTQGFFPMVVDPGQTEATMILPSDYWPPQMLAFWQPGRS
jgi:hypothetical protein